MQARGALHPGFMRVVGVAARAHLGLTTCHGATDAVVPHKPCRLPLALPQPKKVPGIVIGVVILL